MASTGTDVRQAMDLLGQYGWTPYRLANELGIHIRTARRWAAGIHQPSPRNLTALRGVVGQLAMREYGLSGAPTPAARLLERAADALTTTAEREANARLETDMRAHLAGNAESETPEVPARIAATDPFDLLGTPEPALPF